MDSSARSACTRLASSAVVLLACVPAYGRERAENVSSPYPATANTVLRIARSTDGRSFSKTGEVFIPHASSADLVLMRDNSLLAIFDLADPDRPNARTIIVSSRSNDGGVSWSPFRPIRVRGARKRGLYLQHADLERMPNGRVRMYAAPAPARGRDGRRARSRRDAVIYSASSRDGVNFRIDGATRLPVAVDGDLHPVVATLKGRTHLFAGNTAPNATAKPVGHRFVSREGRRFTEARHSGSPGVVLGGSIVKLEAGLRSYTSTPTGMRSFVSRDGRDWVAEAGGQFPDGWDPAVVRLEDGTYLMVYSAPLTEGVVGSSQLVTAYDDEPIDEIVWDEEDEGDFEATEGDDQLFLVDVDGDDDADDASEVAGDVAPELVLTDATEAPPDSSWPVDKSLQGNWRDQWDPSTTGGFAPRPDFKTKVEYYDWYREFALDHPEDNAYFAYEAFFPSDNDGADGKPVWPEFDDMNNGDYEGPPIPWDETDHPEWAATSDATAYLRDLYREASLHDGYASRADLKERGPGDDPDSEKLLIGLMLPALAPHRLMVKAVMADAWRQIGGKVSADRMLEAWRTSYRAAGHMERGATLIEDLIGTAERSLVQKNARWALKRDIFSAAQLKTAFDVLHKHDRVAKDPGLGLRGEHAFSMDITQYLFSPPAPDGTPRVNMDRAELVAEDGWLEGRPDILARWAQMKPGDAARSLDAFDSYYRILADQMRIGYPAVRAEDIEAIAERYVHTTPLTEFMMPALSRYYELKARLETSRRATQLAYATQLFKAKNGRFPKSLDELPAEYGEEIRIDPFSGKPFGYQLTEDGPKIYSVSSNGIDDGGIHRARWGDHMKEGETSDDYVFYPPQEPN